jgi:Voltage gated chloride channel
MGLQYFEALSPATISSIVAVLVSRLVMKNDVTGYFTYPMLEETLPSTIFGNAVVYGLYGCGVGILYVEIVKYMKVSVHGWFHEDFKNENDAGSHYTQKLTIEENIISISEHTPLIQQDFPTIDRTTETTDKATLKSAPTFKCLSCCFITHEPTRAAVAGMFAGAFVGIIGVFVPHSLFFGEGQLQSLIDGGRTPLPIFTNSVDNPVRDLTHLSYCLVDPNDAEAMKNGFGASCSLVLSLTRTITTGLSLGTGIIGGQFWGPLCVGCAAAHFFSALFSDISERYGFGSELAAYPCIAILCTMASTHVGKYRSLRHCWDTVFFLICPPLVLFRSHLGIMLILTLSISAFKPEEVGESNKAGDYSAVFPLLVIAVFTALMTSVGTTFYPSQTSRGDIVAVPEILCRPGRSGNPIVTQFGGSDSDSGSMATISSDVEPSNLYASISGRRNFSSQVPASIQQRSLPMPLNLSPIATEFSEMETLQPPPPPESESPASVRRTTMRDNSLSRYMKDREYKRTESYTPPASYRKHDNTGCGNSTTEKKVRHHTFGNLDGRQQPSLLEQARKNSNHSVTQQHSLHRRTSSNPSSYSFSDASHGSK